MGRPGTLTLALLALDNCIAESTSIVLCRSCSSGSLGSKDRVWPGECRCGERCASSPSRGIDERRWTLCSVSSERDLGGDAEIPVEASSDEVDILAGEDTSWHRGRRQETLYSANSSSGPGTCPSRATRTQIQGSGREARKQSIFSFSVRAA